MRDKEADRENSQCSIIYIENFRREAEAVAAQKRPSIIPKGFFMKALTLKVDRTTWTQTTGYELQDIPTPTLDSSEQALIEPLFAGMCGTDKGIWFRKAFRESILSHLEKDKRNFYVMGHEMLGRVVEIGQNTRNIKVGDIVSTESHIFCGHCPMCLQATSTSLR
ncbi:MAG: alcohol dehydrogenase catalytic domain-containing protein [Oligoflexia bacterium]|nr:alcohol dehydrogenase catalytic domain-containing protein [Oligoflexia bacterium]